ncbi:hypothetical protein Tco_1052506 [Tanacetum coccineum]
MSLLKALIKQHNERSGTLIEQFLLSFGHDEGNDKGKDVDKETGNTKDEDLQKPSKEVLRSLFTKQIIEFSALKHLMPTNLWIYDGSTVQDDHVSRLVGSANQWEWIIQKASETLINFKERWMDEMSYIQDVPEWMISSNPKKFIGAQTPKGRVPEKGHRALPQGDRPPRSTYGGGHKRTDYHNCFNIHQDHYEPYVPPRANNKRQRGNVRGRQQGNNNSKGKTINMIQAREDNQKPSSPYKELRAISSTIHAMMKFLTPRGIATLVARTIAVFECQHLEEKQTIYEEKAEEKEPEREEYSAVEEVLVNPAFPEQKVTIRTQCSKECRL